MQQILVVLSADADADAISTAVTNNSGSVHSVLAPTVVTVDGDQPVLDALKAAAGVVATLSDDDAKTATASTDVTQLDISGMGTFLGTTLGVNTTFEEPVILAITGWMYGQSDRYATLKSDRPRDGETWDMDGGCLPTDSSFANS